MFIEEEEGKGTCSLPLMNFIGTNQSIGRKKKENFPSLVFLSLSFSLFDVDHFFT